MLRLTQNHSSFTAILELEGLSADKTYVIGDRLKGKLTFTPKRNLTILSMRGELSYVVKGNAQTDKILAHREKLLPYRELKAGETCEIDLLIPFHFGRPNFKGGRLDNFWSFTVLIIREIPKDERTILQLIPGMDKKMMEANFIIPVAAGKGSFKVKAQPLPIQLISGEVIGIGSFLTLGLMVALGFIMPEPGVSNGLFFVLALMGLLGIILYHFLHLSNFKMTPMEIKPLRDGKIRIRYLNRGKNHLNRAYIGIRLKEHYIVEDSNNNYSRKSSVLHENRYKLGEIARPLDHLNEATIPWPELPNGTFPTSYGYQDQGYEWEVFLAASGLVIGGLNEISWPIRVDWERMRLTVPTTQELAEEKLELKELADNKVVR
ncbi:hypothetical protein [Neolewinella agarilytica]|uniref:Arrestin-like N-terminal domain-containing protein n=1 Tax=Neolewinella agarilytica TaxID=478744 RepID=A0A1H9I541_9BACT|nr:hypothetical protein [Neolewinella agarilytica]SEQ69673.1 hypothetical protein SAMN05444359_11444 [Neolewinella agarilytica]